MKKLYDFKCTACSEVFEDMVEQDVETVECPGCLTAGAKRVLTGDRTTYRKTDKRENHTTLNDLRWRAQ